MDKLTMNIPRGYSGPFTRVGYGPFAWLQPRGKSTHTGEGEARAEQRLAAKREANALIHRRCEPPTRQQERAVARAAAKRERISDAERGRRAMKEGAGNG